MNLSTTSKLLITGGEQKILAHFKPEWHGFRKAKVLEVDLQTGAVSVPIEYESPQDVTVDTDASHLFKSGTVNGHKFWVCTNTEVMAFDLRDYSRIWYLTHPAFNDLHDVQISTRDTVLVANTGLDAVMEFDRSGALLNEWSALGGSMWDRFSRDTDYRKWPTTKPHRAHPNKVFEIDGSIFATRFEQCDAICLEGHDSRFQLGADHPHDGNMVGERVYFTTITGSVVVCDPNGSLLDRYDLNAFNNNGNEDISLGWCRGLHVVNDRYLIVGFTRLRPSRFREQVRWVKHALGRAATKGNRATRIAIYDLKAGCMVREYDLEPFGLNAIFAILPEPSLV